MGFAGTWVGRFFINRLGLLNAGAVALTLQVSKEHALCSKLCGEQPQTKGNTFW